MKILSYKATQMETGKMVSIDEAKCNGCGLCIPSCAEGALKIVDGKARLVGELCDGLGACLGTCPQGAITISERPAIGLDEKKAQSVKLHQDHGGCPGSATRTAADFRKSAVSRPTGKGALQESELRQWPVQLSLMSPDSPSFDDCDLLVSADCVPFANANFHSELLKGRTLVIGCPKLDDAEAYTEKLAAILGRNDIKSVTVANMEVPCCFGLARIVGEAVRRSGKNVPVGQKVVKITG